MPLSGKPSCPPLRQDRSFDIVPPGGKALWREPPGLRKLAGKGLVADDERQLHDLSLCKMLPYARQALFGHLEVVAGNPLAELERGPLPLAEARALSVCQDIGELLRRDTRLHADGVTDVHSVRRAVERGHLDVEQGAKLSVDLPEPLDGAIETPNPRQERQPTRHESLGSRHLAEHALPDLEECPGQQAGRFDLRGLCHKTLLCPLRNSVKNVRAARFPHDDLLLSRATKRRFVPLARRPRGSIRNPKASTVLSVSRFGWHPPVTQVQIGWMKSCRRATHGMRERTCSSMRSSPRGRSTRLTSSSPRRGSSTLQKTRPLSTVSNVPSRNGSASAQPTTSGTAGARRCARFSASSEGSRATAL